MDPYFEHAVLAVTFQPNPLQIFAILFNWSVSTAGFNFFYIVRIMSLVPY